MILEEAIQHLRESLADTTHKWGCEECKTEHEKLLEWMEDYKRLQSVSSWIPCSERMPEPGVDVLVTDGINQMVTWHEVIDGKAMWVDNFIVYVNVRFGEVTHWMPLPEPPKEV